MSTFNTLLTRYQTRVASAMAYWLPSAEDNSPSTPQRLNAAMLHSMNAGGKRVRPFLCYATGVALGVDESQLDGPATALELIHTYSLIHDDLPAMDDDDLRRGQPTCHKAFDEATAILAGDGMLTLAFSVLTEDVNMQQNPDIRIKMIQTLANASGVYGMVGGQAIDIANEGRGGNVSLDELKHMHALKTGALIRAAVQLGALSCPTLTAEQYESLTEYAECIGLAFQVQDDVLDVTASTEALGKQQGADIALNKATYTALLGLDGARDAAQQLYQQAIESLSNFDERADTLRDLAKYIVEREH